MKFNFFWGGGRGGSGWSGIRLDVNEDVKIPKKKRGGESSGRGVGGGGVRVDVTEK